MSPSVDSPGFHQLSAPFDDGGILIYPASNELLHFINDSRAAHRRTRVSLLGAGASRQDERPVVMTGHQPEFMHPGVWVKNVVAVALARRAGGDAEFVAVDSDAAA